MPARLNMICCGSTAATRKAIFATEEEPLEEAALAAARAMVADPGAADLGRADRAWTGPELRSRQTAEALGLDATAIAHLRDRNFGRWTGVRLADLQNVDPAGLQAVMSDPQATPPEGESLAQFSARTVVLMQSLLQEKGNLVVVTHPSVIRVAVLHAIGAPITGFWRVDIESLAQVRFTSDGRRWALRMKGPRMAGAVKEAAEK